MLIGNIKYLDETIKDDKYELSMNSVKSNFIDKEIFETALEDTKTLKTIEDRNVDTPFFKQLGQDIFNSMYKIRPEIYDKKNLYNSLHMENDILRQLINNDKFLELRRNTCGDMFNSTLGLSTFQEQAYTIIQKWMETSEENKEMMNNINNALDKQQEIQNLMNDIENGDVEENSQSLLDSLKQDIQNLNDNVDNPSNNMKNSLDTLSNQLTNAANKSSDIVKESSDMMNNLGLGSGNEHGNNNNSIPFEQKKKLVNILKDNDKFKDICNELGRVKETVGKINKKPSKYGQIIFDIGTGDNIKKILNSEKVKLLDKDLENDFYKRYLDKNLLEYKTQGIEETKGPIVICLDTSGSMSGSREIWSKAVALASLQLAIKQKRNYRCITFDTSVGDVIDADYNSPILETSVLISESFEGGGTKYHGALKKALESISESKFKKADILFITDGCPNDFLPVKFLEEFISAKNNKGFKVQSILIGTNKIEYLKEFSDDIITLNDLNDNNALINVFNNMKSI